MCLNTVIIDGAVCSVELAIVVITAERTYIPNRERREHRDCVSVQLYIVKLDDEGALSNLRLGAPSTSSKFG